jgi:sterol desaturase/sphingolipid hydroxylase (fatty acid hydroxylase superfamily)
MKEFFIYILYYDFCYYFLHRLLHTRFFYPIHKIHHRKINTDYYDYYTVNVLEIPLTSLGLLLAVYLHNLYTYQLICSVIFINIRGVMIHDNRFVFLVGDHHLIHHKYIKCNYGEIWLDYVFGTQYCNKKITS